MSPGKKKPGSGDTAVRHARAVVARDWPGAPLLEAMAHVVYIPIDRKNPKLGRRPINIREDLFGVFDMLVLPAGNPIVLIQVTTQTEARSTVADRKRKIRFWILQQYGTVPGLSLAPFMTVLILAWVPKQHFRCWRWDWAEMDWNEGEQIESPLLAKNRTSASPLLAYRARRS